MRLLSCLVTCVGVLAAPAQAACLGPSPSSAALQLFERHRDFAFKAPEPSFIAPDLMAALKVETRCGLMTKGVCSLNGDPWTDAQEGEIQGDAQVAAASQSRYRAIVQLKFSFSPDSSEPQKTVDRVAEVSLQRRPGSRCWRVSNLKASNMDLQATLWRSRALLQESRRAARQRVVP